MSDWTNYMTEVDTMCTFGRLISMQYLTVYLITAHVR